jgi:hypothetical protein
MRNPLHFSSELLVKRAAPQPPVLNIPAYSARPGDGATPAMSDDQISGLLQNIQSYPEEQQQKMLDSINKDYGNSSYRGGLVGSALGNLGNWGSSAFNALQQGANWASKGLFGAKPFDAQDSDRYRAETVLRTAAKNPEMYKRITDRLNTATAPAATTPAATTPAATTPAATTPAATTPATPNAPAATPAAPAPSPAAPATQTPPGVPKPTFKDPAAINRYNTAMAELQATPSTTPPAPLVSAPPTPAAPTPAPTPAAPTAQAAPQNPTPWLDAKSKFNSSWTPDQKSQYIKSKYGETTPEEKARSTQVSNYLNPKPVSQTTDRWGRSLQAVAPAAAPATTSADRIKSQMKSQRDQQAIDRGQERINTLTAQHGKSYWDGEEGQKDLARYQKGIY